MKFIYEFSEKQNKLIKSFVKKQEEKTDGEYGSIGGAYTYHFTPTSIGTVIKLENTVTKETIDLSDYDHW